MAILIISRSLQSRSTCHQPHLAALRDRRIMTAPEASHLGTQLDEDHAPETNGRMSVCRRCGTQTDGAAGLHHTPNERQLARSKSWLIAEVQRRRIERARDLHPRDLHPK